MQNKTAGIKVQQLIFHLILKLLIEELFSISKYLKEPFT